MLITYLKQITCKYHHKEHQQIDNHFIGKPVLVSYFSDLNKLFFEIKLYFNFLKKENHLWNRSDDRIYSIS